MKNIWKRFCILSLLLLSVISPLFGESKTEYAPNMVAGDGKNGNAWGQWTQKVKEAPVTEVRMWLKREKGDDNTYVNLRFGRDGKTLDGGKRVQIPGKETQVSWNVGGVSPNGKPLVLNAYKGEVKVLKVVVTQK